MVEEWKLDMYLISTRIHRQCAGISVYLVQVWGKQQAVVVAARRLLTTKQLSKTASLATAAAQLKQSQSKWKVRHDMAIVVVRFYKAKYRSLPLIFLGVRYLRSN